jgi:hypothetical protein
MQTIHKHTHAMLMMEKVAKKQKSSSNTQKK